ncbi:MAG: PIG-L family deacetylase [Phycisphaerae bacterium]|nr:PIG-L family deacetylase [Phycisphaerae bacterium]
MLLLKDAARTTRRWWVQRASDVLSERRAVSDLPALVVAPHPDDEVFATGGTIALKRASGVPVDVLFLTRGDASHRTCCQGSSEEVAANRRRLAHEAGGGLGLSAAELHWLDLPDGGVPRPGTRDFARAVASVERLLEERLPVEVYCPHALDVWPDHVAANRIVEQALGRARHDCHGIRYLVWAWHCAPFRQLARLEWRRSWRIPLGGAYQIKEAAMRCYLESRSPRCGRPWCGALPDGFLEAFRWPFELFFQNTGS